jgi:hypothetical protein
MFKKSEIGYVLHSTRTANQMVEIIVQGKQYAVVNKTGNPIERYSRVQVDMTKDVPEIISIISLPLRDDPRVIAALHYTAYSFINAGMFMVGWLQRYGPFADAVEMLCGNIIMTTSIVIGCGLTYYYVPKIFGYDKD